MRLIPWPIWLLIGGMVFAMIALAVTFALLERSDHKRNTPKE